MTGFTGNPGFGEDKATHFVVSGRALDRGFGAIRVSSIVTG
jgi:hypothetical protein